MPVTTRLEEVRNEVSLLAQAAPTARDLMQDMVKLMGPNTASYIQMGDQLGTLESGKLAEIILLNGDPLEGYWNWLKTKVVVKGGVVVVDKR